jgi:co-chaperonin GroES (HSP10)
MTNIVNAEGMRIEANQTKEINNSVTSFIEKREEDEAKVLIENLLEFPPPRMAGYFLAVKMYVSIDDTATFRDPKTGVETLIIKPDVVKNMERWHSCVGLVVALGPDCYTHEKFKHSGPWCKVGDWIVFPRHEGRHFLYRGVPIYFIPDDRIYCIVDDPSYIHRD